MTVLIFSQILFNLTVSFAILGLAVLLGLIAYNLMLITRDLSRISNNFSEASDDMKERLEEVLERLAEVPFLSAFMQKKSSARHNKKGRE